MEFPSTNTVVDDRLLEVISPDDLKELYRTQAAVASFKLLKGCERPCTECGDGELVYCPGESAREVILNLEYDYGIDTAGDKVNEINFQNFTTSQDMYEVLKNDLKIQAESIKDIKKGNK